MHSKTSPGLLVLVALGAAACGPGRQPVATTPVPAEAPPPAPADTVQAIGEGFPLRSERPAAVGADLLGTARYDLPVEANEWVRQEVDFLVNQRGPVVAGWMTAADRYGEWVRDVFASYGIPRDLSHLGMVESGYRPTVRSHAGAVGMWQFMPATGRGMGLRIDELVDERMDPVRSTHAAARHLRDLNRQFRGDWALAAAAYNAGTGRISRGLGRFGVTNFWDLAQRGDLAEETRHYVPRLYAVTIIAKDPTRFGLPARGPQRAFGFDSIRVDLATPLSVLASVGNIPLPDLVELNPHLLRQVAPPRYWVWVPAGQGAALQPAYAASEFRQRGGYDSYRVREGDSLDRLAELSGLPAERIRQLNLPMGETVQPGQQLRLFADAARVLNERPMPRVARAETSERSSTASSSGRRRPRVLGDPPVPDDAEKESPARSSDTESASGRTREASTSGASSSRRSSEGASGSSSSDEGSSTRRGSEGSAARRTESATRSSDGESSGSRASGTRRASSEGSSARSSEGSTTRSSEGSSSRSSEGTPSTRRASSENSRSSEGSSARSSEGSSSTRRASSESSSEGSSSRSSEGSSATRRASGEGSASRSEGSSSRSASATGERSSSSTRSSERSSAAESGSSSAARRTESASERPSASRTEGAARSSSASTRAPSETPRASGSTASRPTGRTHEVAEGETLWGIARRYDVTVAAVREANDLSESESLQPGRTLRIPRASSTTSGSSETRTAAGSASTATRPTTGATRSSGETRAAGTGPSGTRPSGTASGSSSSATRSTGAASTRPAASASGARTSSRQHTVADGETLWGIARRYEITVDALRRANDLGENTALQPGQKLTIPAS